MSELTYTRSGDYLIPDLSLTEQPQAPLGKYGRMRKDYLKEHRPVLWNSLLLRNEVGRVAPYLLLLPVFSVLGGIVFLGEALDTGRMIGGAVVLAGVALITLEGRRPKVSPLAPPLSPP